MSQAGREFRQRIFDGRSRHGDPEVCLDEPRGFRRGGVGVFDGLRFIENACVKCDFREFEGVVAKRAVGRQDDVVMVEGVRIAGAAGACVDADAEMRREFLRFGHPVENKRLRNDDKRRAVAALRMP